MNNVTEAITIFFTAVVLTAVGFEIKRRQKKLRALYDVLDSETKHIAAQLEDMVQQGALSPYTEETWA